MTEKSPVTILIFVVLDCPHLFEVIGVDVLDHLGHHLGLELFDGHLVADLVQSLLSLEHRPEDVRPEPGLSRISSRLNRAGI